jgi:hypothetical protein
MTRSTKALSGVAKDKLLRGLVAGVAHVPDDVARRVTDVLTSSLTEVRVRRDAWETVRHGGVPAPVAPPAEAKVAPAAKPATAASIETFDPYGFSAVALLTRKGKAALAAELDKIDSAEHLRQIATAQHLAIDPGLADVAGIRAALVAATERRIAERKAAAS